MKYDDIFGDVAEEQVVCEGDANKWSVGITRETVEIILKSGALAPVSDMLALWMFYAYTARWQHTNRPKATVSFVMKGLDWGRDKVRRARQGLMKLKLIEDVQTLGDGGQITATYVKINHITKGTLMDESTLLKTSRVVKFKPSTPLKNHRVARPEGGNSGGKMLG